MQDRSQVMRSDCHRSTWPAISADVRSQTPLIQHTAVSAWLAMARDPLSISPPPARTFRGGWNRRHASVPRAKFSPLPMSCRRVIVSTTLASLRLILGTQRGWWMWSIISNSDPAVGENICETVFSGLVPVLHGSTVPSGRDDESTNTHNLGRTDYLQRNGPVIPPIGMTKVGNPKWHKRTIAV
jgi:hypothetical protein